MNKKPVFTEIEIEEMCDLYYDKGFEKGVSEVLQFLKSLGYSDVHKDIITLRKEFINTRVIGIHKSREDKYPNSTLQRKLSQRIDFTDNKF